MRAALTFKEPQSALVAHLLLVDLLLLPGVLAGATFNWLVTFLTPAVSLAMRSASALASGVSTVPRRVTSPLTTSTLIFLSGVFESPISWATIFIWIQASSSVLPTVSLFALARALSSFACASEYFGVAVGAGVAAVRGALMLAFALAFKFVVVSLQAVKLKLTAPIAATHNHSFVLIFASFLSNVPEKESPASPFAGDSVAEILNSFADFSPGPPDCLLNSSFKPLLLAAVFEAAVAG